MYSFLIGLFLLQGSSAQAFQLGEHDLLTRQAFTEFFACFPDLQFSAEEMAQAASGNRWEDLNLVRKWTRHSHYYHPEKPDLRIGWRENASGRVMDLELLMRKRMKGARNWGESMSTITALMEELGHAVHYQQDMASPPHVVPVMHDLRDGFEGAEMEYFSQFPLFQMDREGCRDRLQTPVAHLGLLSILNFTARTTLQRVKSPLQLTWAGKTRTGTWELFWKEGLGNTVGDYGLLGNTFGEYQRQVNGDQVVVETEVFRRFKKEQLRIGVNATVQALYWLACEAGVPVSSYCSDYR